MVDASGGTIGVGDECNTLTCSGAIQMTTVTQVSL